MGKTYILTEKRPADGYVTADSIGFAIKDSGEVQSVQMKDDTTKINLIRLAGDTGQGPRGAKFEVFDSNDKNVFSCWDVLVFLSSVGNECVYDETGEKSK